MSDHHATSTSTESPLRPSPRDASLALLPELGAAPVRRRRSRHRMVIALSALLSAVLVAGLFIGSFAYYGWSRHHVAQISTHAPPPDAANLADFRAFAAATPGTAPAPIVLAYHNVAPGEATGRYTVTPKAFDAQMRMLSESGFKTLTQAQLLGYLNGTYQPVGRTVVLTFDDGAAGLWTYADTTVKRYGFHAVSFLITGDVGTRQPYYLSWPQVEKLHASGRWDFGSHTNAQHTRAPSGTDGKDRPSLTNRLNINGSRESMAAFEKRVRSDLAAATADMTAQGLPAPKMFAWPFSSLVHRATDPQAAKFVRNLVEQKFAANFSNPASSPQPATRRQAATGMFERLEVMNTTSARQLFDELGAMQTLTPAAAPDPLSSDHGWVLPGGKSADFRTRSGSLIPTGKEKYVRLNWAPQRTADWTAYTVSTTATGLAAKGVSAGLLVRVGSAAELAIRVSGDHATVQNADGDTLASSRIASADTHTVAVKVTDGATTFSVDGAAFKQVAAPAGPSSTGGVGVISARSTSSSALPAFRDIHVTAG